MKWTTLIPTHLNDGSPVDREIVNATLRDWALQFGGVTVEGTSEGIWIDGDQVYHDECRRVTVICDNDLYPAAKAAVEAIGRQLGQLAMYFEVRDFDGVRFLRID